MVRESRRIVDGRRESCEAFPTGASLLGRVLRAELSDLYSKPTENQTYQPFIASKIVEPSLDSPRVDLISALPPEIAHYYHNLDQLLRGPAEVSQVRQEFAGRYCRCAGPSGEWAAYLNRREVAPLWSFRPASEAMFLASISAVAKKDGAWLRKLLQCVPLNAAIVTPAEMLQVEQVDYGLVGALAITQMSGDDGHLAVQTVDESNAFTHVVTPEAWWPYMGGPQIKAGELREELRDPDWLASTLICPMHTRLGMGFAHAAFLLQHINYAATRAIRVSSLLTARSEC